MKMNNQLLPLYDLIEKWDIGVHEHILSMGRGKNSRPCDDLEVTQNIDELRTKMFDFAKFMEKWEKTHEND